MNIPEKLKISSGGKLLGPNVTYNSPWPCKQGDAGSMQIPHGIMGVIMHTMVGNLPGTIEVFNTDRGADSASAHFGIDQKGNIHQFGPVNGWMAWAQEAGNPNWYSIEHADNANPDTPLTQAQVNASAQIVEALSAYGLFPLQESNNIGEEGYGVHYMGSIAWGGHSCPDLPPASVRSHQRPAILALAQQIRDGNVIDNPKLIKPHYYRWAADGTMSLDQIARSRNTTAKALIEHTEASSSPINDAHRASFQNYVVSGTENKMPSGMIYYTVNGA